MLKEAVLSSLLGERKFPVLAERCVRQWHRGARCSRCSEACPEKAVTVSSGGIELDWERCTSCGKCIPACPTEALAPLTQPIPESSAVQVACSHQQGLVGVKGRLLLPGLWALDRQLLLILAGKGVSRISIQGCGKCGMSGTALEEHRQKLLDGQPGLAIEIVEAGETKEMGRREFFSLLGREGHSRSLKLAGDVTAAVRERLAPPAKRSPAVPERRRMLIGLGQRHPLPLRQPLLTGMSASAACDGCMMCARFCPTGALTEERDEEKGKSLCLGFSAEKCVQCDLCIDICPKACLAYKPLDSPDSPPQDTALFSAPLGACPSCGKEALGGGLCLRCAKEQRLVAGMGG